MRRRSRRIATLFSQRGGFALPAAIIVLIVVMLIGFGYLSLGFHETNLARKEVDNVKSFFVAEAGIQRAVYTLSITADWSTLPSQMWSNEPLGEGTYSVRVVNKTANTATVESVGVVHRRDRTIQLSAERP